MGYHLFFSCSIRRQLIKNVGISHMCKVIVTKNEKCPTMKGDKQTTKPKKTLYRLTYSEHLKQKISQNNNIITSPLEVIFLSWIIPHLTADKSCNKQFDSKIQIDQEIKRAT